MATYVNEATQAGGKSARSRLDEILARHRKRRIRAIATLILWTVFCAAMLAL